MSSGPCQKPAAAERLAQRAARKRGSLLRHHAQRDDAPLGFARPGQHQLRSAHRLLIEHAHLPETVVVLADVAVRRATLLSVAPITGVVRHVDRDVIGNGNAERAPRAGLRACWRAR